MFMTSQSFIFFYHFDFKICKPNVWCCKSCRKIVKKKNGAGKHMPLCSTPRSRRRAGSESDTAAIGSPLSDLSPTSGFCSPVAPAAPAKQRRSRHHHRALLCVAPRRPAEGLPPLASHSPAWSSRLYAKQVVASVRAPSLHPLAFPVAEAEHPDDFSSLSSTTSPTPIHDLKPPKRGWNRATAAPPCRPSPISLIGEPRWIPFPSQCAIGLYLTFSSVNSSSLHQKSRSPPSSLPAQPPRLPCSGEFLYNLFVQ